MWLILASMQRHEGSRRGENGTLDGAEDVAGGQTGHTEQVVRKN